MARKLPPVQCRYPEEGPGLAELLEALARSELRRLLNEAVEQGNCGKCTTEDTEFVRNR